ncbi:hypothetical protein CXF85_14785 [Colwellia sp. 75C3]|nr:hypothetical protein CXF85_14785 [Colwellia sp. 75C3]
MNNILAINTHKQPKVTLRLFSMIFFIILFVTFFSLKSFANIDNAQSLKNPKRHGTKLKVIIVISSDKHGYWLPEVLYPSHLKMQFQSF